jgi:hypothetical protein
MSSNNSRRNGRRASNRSRRRPAHPTKVFASLALLDSLIEEVSLTVASFLAQNRTTRNCLSEITTRKVIALVNTRPYQTDEELRCRLAFWESLIRVYGHESASSRERIISLLDAWQNWIRCSSALPESALLDMTQWWLEEFDHSDVGWRPPRGRREINFFAAERIRDAAHMFLRIHRSQHPEVIRVSDIRRARAPRREESTTYTRPRRFTSQPMYVPSIDNYLGRDRVPIRGLRGNIEDYWPFPK